MHVWNEEEVCGLTDEERRVSRRLLTQEARGPVRRCAPWLLVALAGVLLGLALGAVIEWVAR